MADTWGQTASWGGPTSNPQHKTNQAIYEENLRRKEAESIAKKEAEALRVKQLQSQQSSALRSAGGNLNALGQVGGGGAKQIGTQQPALQAQALGGFSPVSPMGMGGGTMPGAPTMGSSGQVVSTGGSVQGGAVPGTPAGIANVTAQTYKPLEDLAAEGKQFREDLRNTTGKLRPKEFRLFLTSTKVLEIRAR